MDEFEVLDPEEMYDVDYPEEDIPADWDLEPEPELLPNPDVPRVPTNEEAEYGAVKAVIQCLRSHGLKLDEFLDALCWGNPQCVGDLEMREVRHQLVRSPRLPSILDQLHTPINYTGKRPQAAAAVLNQWAWRHAMQLARAELDCLTLDAQTDNAESDLANIPDVESIKFKALSGKATHLTPNLVRFLTLIGESKSQARARRHSGAEDVVPSFPAVMNVHSLAFQFAPRCNKLQKHMSLYFRAKHVPKSLFVLFNRCGYTTSYQWSALAVKNLSKEALQKMRDVVQNHAFFWIYDNLRLATPIKAQRGDRHTVTDNGTAMTVVQLPDTVKHVFFKDTSGDPTVGTDSESVPPAPVDHKHLSWDDFSDFERLGQLAALDIFMVSDILFETVPGLANLEVRLDKKLAAPELHHVMPSGSDHKTCYFMLGTVPIDETSVGGNMQVITELLQATGLNSPENQKLLGTGVRTVASVGDQMTAARGRMLKSLRIRDPNGYERLSWLVVVPAWWHILLNLGMATFDTHRGSDHTTGTFYSDLKLLNRVGLSMNILWMHYSGTNTAESLAEWVRSASADTLSKTARRIYFERVASSAAESLASEPQPDENLLISTLQTHDLLQYYSVRSAIQSGNVGWLEDLIPNLLVYFKGRENYNYALELAEAMQWMYHEASPEMRAVVRDHTWLVNTSGRPDGFYESDRLQEFNNGKQKQFGPPPQTTSWEAHKEISPAIPVLGEIAQQLEDDLFDFHRTRVHKGASAEGDINLLANRHLTSKIHEHSPGRKLDAKADNPKDYVELGTEALINTDWLAKLAEHRKEFIKLQSTEQVYSLESEANSPPTRPSQSEAAVALAEAMEMNWGSENMDTDE
ncbi:hypothetical protein FRC08_008582 [Ceratobasidium sp. 394]|nr:hypothetical protein FRC08_008582 [Ceratobasidium sp. 394]